MSTTHSRNILIVDDEEPVRQVQRRILEQAGFTVHEAWDGEEALTILRGDLPLELVVADIDMPNLAGDDMAREVATVRPGLKVLFVTGNANKLFQTERALNDDRAFLSKPFTAGGLVEAVSLLRWGTLRPQFGAD